VGLSSGLCSVSVLFALRSVDAVSALCLRSFVPVLLAPSVSKSARAGAVWPWWSESAPAWPFFPRIAPQPVLVPAVPPTQPSPPGPDAAEPRAGEGGESRSRPRRRGFLWAAKAGCRRGVCLSRNRSPEHPGVAVGSAASFLPRALPALVRGAGGSSAGSRRSRRCSGFCSSLRSFAWCGSVAIRGQSWSWGFPGVVACVS